jgi:hypothetical protein
MSQAGLGVAANVLDERALVLEAGSMPTAQCVQRTRERPGGAMLFASILATLAAILRR